MNDTPPNVAASRETPGRSVNGWIPVAVHVATGIFLVWCWGHHVNVFGAYTRMIFILACAIWLFCLRGYFILQPNTAQALVLFGRYLGTVRRNGFHWVNPFMSGAQMGGRFVPSWTVSLRARNFETSRLKVNDKNGNPVEIAAVVVWRVQDTAQALFDVDDYKDFVHIQSETALRHLASRYGYDHAPDGEPTLRGDIDRIGEELRRELRDRLAKAGVEVEEARLTHLAYAPEIASAMLKRQQAEAVLAARRIIVEGAVGMVEMALSELKDRDIVTLDNDRRAALAGNLLVVLCSEQDTHPVLNAGN